jgi:transposase
MKTHSMDLRERVVAAIDAQEGSQREIARRYGVSVSFIVRLLQHRRATGGLEPSPHGGGRSFSLDAEARRRLAAMIGKRPDATLQQLKTFGSFDCTLTTLWRTLRRMGLTRKKKTLRASERDRPDVQTKRARYRRKVRKIEPKRLVFLDETGLATTMTLSYGWARRGERVFGSIPTTWKSTTLIAAVALDGAFAPLAFPGALDRTAFQVYTEEVLAPLLRPGDVVVLDNLAAHNDAAAALAIKRAGAEVLRLPPYSSDYNPIEEMWSKLKHRLRQAAARTTERLHQALTDAFDHITTNNIEGWFRHSGLYASQK